MQRALHGVLLIFFVLLMVHVAAARSKTTKPKCGDNLQPTYTEDAKKAKIEGIVVLIVDVSDTGCVLDARVAKGLGHGLDQGAVQAVKTWKFTPATKNGQPVRVLIRVEVSFKLPKGTSN